MKQAHDDLDQARFIAEETRLDLYSGDDPNTFAFLELGGVGVVSVTAHLWGPQIAEMIRRHRDGDVDGARALHEEQQPSYDLLRIQTNPIPIKAALNLTGHEVGGHRLPMVERGRGRARADPLLPRARPGFSPPRPRSGPRLSARWASAGSSRSAASARSART